MNEITLAEAKNQIGPGSYRFLDYLSLHMGDLLCEPARMAQSIVTRSEVELFGLSAPRFAARVYLRNGGFVNCRRIATLVEMFKLDNFAEWGNRYEDKQLAPEQRNSDLEKVQEPHLRIEEVLKDQSCIADSLLVEPRRLTRYRLSYLDASSAKLAEAYSEGERFDASLIRKLLPYTNTMDLGGGLCAQAVIFMATAVLAKYAKSVHGIAEITALAHDWQCRELALGSLEPEGMDRYFGTVNLRLMEQSLTQRPSDHITETRAKHFSSAIRCYLDSSMPVLFPTSTHKLSKQPSLAQSIYGKNGLKIAAADVPPDEDHLVVIVGSGKKGEETDAQFFVMHDSATLPFLVATLAEMMSVGVTRKLPNVVSDNGVMMAIVPRPVRMPLLDERIYVAEPNQPTRIQIRGMRFGLDTFTRLFHYVSNYPCPAQPNLVPDRFRLIRSDNPKSVFKQCAPDYQLLLECGLLRAISIMETKFSWHKPHWLWIEAFQSSLWVWNAEVPPTETLPSTEVETRAMAGNGLLLCTIRIDAATDSGSAEIEFFVPPVNA